MITNDIKKLKEDCKILRDEIEKNSNFKVKFFKEFPSNSQFKADCLPDFNNNIFKIRLRKNFTNGDYIHVLHELFHGILWIKEKFSYVFEKNENIETIKVRNLISTYIDDIVVHKRILLLGYNAIDPIYSIQLRKPLYRIKQRKPHLILANYGTGKAGDLFKALYYIHAKDFKKNYKDCFNESGFKNIKKFIKVFPREHKENARKIEKLLKKYDIHSASGNDIIKKEIIKMTGLENDIVVRKISVE